MNNTQHTPGPWYIAHHTDIDGMKSIDIRHCCDIPHSTPQIHQVARLPENTMANAHLISAAPDLLSALETLLSAVEFIECQSDEGRLFSIERLHMGHDKGIREAKEAIAKAKGAA